MSRRAPHRPTEPCIARKPDLTGITEYLRQYQPHMMRCFARHVIKQGYGAMTPGYGPERRGSVTWQALGRKMWGEEFNSVLREEITAAQTGEPICASTESSNQDQPESQQTLF